MNKYVVVVIIAMCLAVVFTFISEEHAVIEQINGSSLENDKISDTVVNDQNRTRENTAGSVSVKPEITIEKQSELKSYDDSWCFPSELTNSAKERVNDEYYRWSHSRNHNVGERKELLNTYHEYGLEALKQLGKQGDLVALAAIVLNSDNSIELQDWAARTAAIYGGTGDALQHISSSRKAKAATLIMRGLVDEAKATFLEGMAWDEFMVLRGDTTLIETTPFLLSQDAFKDIRITERDEKWVSTRAKEIYSELSNERQKLGLGVFDNSVPKSVQIENLAAAAYAKSAYKAPDYHMKHFPKDECLNSRLELMVKE